ncbi:Endonuclease/exonuclease/phosphatase [Actinobacteria bacterium OK074]|nr:Endonuclease/exonuclease/phosphatase [Actinobacteria bacterium OK074]
MSHAGVTRRRGLKGVAAAAIAVPLLATAGSTAVTPSAAEPGFTDRVPGGLHVMTYNLRFASSTGDHRWAHRRPAMRELLLRAGPHVLGTQEGLYHQLREIGADLGPHYAWIGTGRGGGSRDEFAALFYDVRRLAPVAYDHFWLSDTPEVINSNTWGADQPRMATWVRFRDRAAAGREFYVLNTHLDHVSQYARERSARLLAHRIAGFDRSLPVVVTGDFNAHAHSNPVYATLLGAGLVDTWETAAERGPLYGTFQNFGAPLPGGDRIDWILTTPGVTTQWARIDTFQVDGRFPSDHLPVRASLTLA